MGPKARLSGSTCRKDRTCDFSPPESLPILCPEPADVRRHVGQRRYCYLTGLVGFAVKSLAAAPHEEDH